MEAILIILALAGLAWMVFTQIHARQQVDVQSPLSPGAAAQVVQQHFGLTWTPSPGAGQFNYTPKLRKWPPTLSVSISPNASGCMVSIWTSEWSSKFGVLNHATLMWRKKRSLAAKMTGALAVTS